MSKITTYKFITFVPSWSKDPVTRVDIALHNPRSVPGAIFWSPVPPSGGSRLRSVEQSNLRSSLHAA